MSTDSADGCNSQEMCYQDCEYLYTKCDTVWQPSKAGTLYLKNYNDAKHVPLYLELPEKNAITCQIHIPRSNLKDRMDTRSKMFVSQIPNVDGLHQHVIAGGPSRLMFSLTNS